MRIKFVVRNRDAKKGPFFSKIFERPLLPPIGMVFLLPSIEEARVDSYYGELLEELGDNDAEVWLHTDDDEGLAKLEENGWVVEYAK